MLADLRGARGRAAAVRGRPDAEPRAARTRACSTSCSSRSSPVVDGRGRRPRSSPRARRRARCSCASVAHRRRGALPALQRVGSGAMQIEGANALVAGGASGLGAATARRLAEAGANVTIADLNAEKGEALARASSARRSSAATSPSPTQVEAAVAAAGEDLRISVCCAGVGWAEKVAGKRGAAPVRAVPDHGHGQPDRHLQRAAPRGRRDARQRARRRRRVRRDRQHRLDRRLRRPDRPDRLRRLEGRRGRDDAARPRATSRAPACACARSPPACSTRRCWRRCPRRRARRSAPRSRTRTGSARPRSTRALAAHIVENPMLNGEVIRLDGALRMAPR